jgi:hypothetical protein
MNKKESARLPCVSLSAGCGAWALWRVHEGLLPPDKRKSRPAAEIFDQTGDVMIVSIMVNAANSVYNLALQRNYCF